MEGEVWLKHPLGKRVSNYGRLKKESKYRKTKIHLGNVTEAGYRKTDIMSIIKVTYQSHFSSLFMVGDMITMV